MNLTDTPGQPLSTSSFHEDIRRRKALEHLDRISNWYLAASNDQLLQDHFSLHGGRAGNALLQSLLFKATGKDVYRLAMERDIEMVIGHIEGADQLPTFCSGLAGVGWLIMYLYDNGFLDIDPDEVLESFDLILEQEMNIMIAQSNFDILHGALGLGLYFLKRNNFAVTGRLIRALDQCCTRRDNAIMWSRFDPFHYKGYLYDFGLAHGNAAHLYFLSKCFRKGIDQPLCGELISGSLNFFTSNIQDPARLYSFFPSHKKAEGYAPTLGHHYSRLAWCYGDPGILHSMLFAAESLNDNNLRTRAVAMLEQAAGRKIRQLTGIEDAGFCHGSAGVASIFLTLHRRTDNPRFKETADHWLDQSLGFGVDPQGICGYRFKIQDEWLNATGLLTGLGGLAITYADYVYADRLHDDSWTECLFLS